MRSVKKLLKKAMVFTLTAAMLVGTPLSVSAAPLNGVYQIEDGFGNVIGNWDNTRTGTVTASDTNSGVLAANAELLGISLDETNLEFELPAKPEESWKELTAKLEWNVTEKDAELTKLENELYKTLIWKSSDTAVATVQVPDGGFGSKEDPKSRNKIRVNAKGAGTATITAILKSDEYGITYTAQATVTVVQYADTIWFDKDKMAEDAYSGNIANPGDWVKTNPEKVSDQITYTVVDSNNPKVSQYNAKKNTLTFKKTAGDKSIWIKAVGKKISSEWTEIKIQKGVNVKQIKFDSNKLEIKVNDGLKAEATATLTPAENDSITDTLSWSSKKPEIVKVVKADTKKPYEGNKAKATLEAVSAGKTQVTVQASSGKKATLNVTVSADLSAIEIAPAEAKFYSGQVVDLSEMAKQYFGKNKGDKANEQFGNAKLVKWSIVDPKKTGDAVTAKDAKKVATVNASGVLTVKPDVKGGKKIAVKVESKSKIKRFGNEKIYSNELIIDLQQISVESITVTRRGYKGEEVLAQGKAVDANGGAKKWVNTKAASCLNKGVDKLAVGDTGVYNIVVKAKDKDNNDINLDGGTLVGWNASGNGKIVKAYKNAAQDGVIDALKRGKSTITINGAMKNPKNGKYSAVRTTFKADVTAPSRTIKLTVKNKGINVKGNKQTITVTPVLEKGTSTNKSRDITWTVENVTKKKPIAQAKEGKVNGRVVLNSSDYAAGDVIKVTAAITNGPKTSITLNVVEPSKNVQFNDKNGTKITKKLPIDNEQPVIVNAVINTTTGKSGAPGTANLADVTYTVNKPEVVMIRKGENGELKIIPTAKGTAKITAKTLDGKTGSLTVQVTKDVNMEEQNRQGILSVE